MYKIVLLRLLSHTLVLRRAIKTLWTVLEEMDRMWIRVRESRCLNQRRHGAPLGLGIPAAQPPVPELRPT